MTRIKIVLSRKQKLALDYLKDNVTTELFYGGGAGGGKSFLGCYWAVRNILEYPGCRGLMGRAVLKSLKESTLLTFFEVCRIFKLMPGKDYKYHSMEGKVSFSNGSEVFLKDLATYPSDPEFDRLGSTEYTWEFIDEGSQISEKARNILMSRIRYKLEEFGLIPKMLIASNPSKNFLYSDFYKPFKEGKLKPYRKFIPALVGDNPFMPQSYIDNLHKLDKISKERLLYGNFEYDNDPSCLFDYDKIIDIFTNKGTEGDKFMSVDVARLGQDKITFFLWKGLQIYKIITKEKQTTDITEKQVEDFAAEYGIPRSNIIIDEDGVGGGVVDHVEGVKGFVNGSRAIEIKQAKGEHKIHSYKNLKSQCYFYLADMVRQGKVGCGEIDPTVKEMLIADLEQIKRKNADKDGPLEVIGKDEIREKLGRSTDFSDAMMMRMFFEIKPDTFSLRAG